MSRVFIRSEIAPSPRDRSSSPSPSDCVSVTDALTSTGSGSPPSGVGGGSRSTAISNGSPTVAQRPSERMRSAAPGSSAGASSGAATSAPGAVGTPISPVPGSSSITSPDASGGVISSAGALEPEPSQPARIRQNDETAAWRAIDDIGGGDGGRTRGSGIARRPRSLRFRPSVRVPPADRPRRSATLSGHPSDERPVSEPILHHYPPSPVSEKIRTAFGIKGLAWRSVEQNRLPERPELFAMTGGYRRIPVLQIGADIYCDTQLIFREIEARAPEPTLFPPDHAGLGFGLSRWIDGELFELGVRVAFAPQVDALPPALVADRTALYFGPDGDMRREREDLPHTLAQLRAHLGWLDERLAAGGTPYLLGDTAAHADLLAWYVVWFVRGRYAGAGEFLERVPDAARLGRADGRDRARRRHADDARGGARGLPGRDVRDRGAGGRP